MNFLAPSYDLRVVVASMAVATLAAYVALALAERVRSEDRAVSRAWWVGGSLALGTGMWSMHFVGMFAYRLPIEIGYTGGLTLASWLAAVAASAVALAVAAGGHLTPLRLIGGSAAMALGICAMHYLGMAAIDLAPGIVWRPWLVVASGVVALLASAAALLIFLALRKLPAGTRGRWALRCAAALAMGLAISGMHYTGMAAAGFPEGAVCRSAGALGGRDISLFVLRASVLILGTTLFVALLDSRMQGKAARLAQSLLAANAQLQEERKRLEEAEAVARMGSWDIDLSTGNVVWSAETYRIYEVDATTFQPTLPRAMALMHPHDRAAVEAALVASYELQGPQSIEHRLAFADGRQKTVEERWQVYRNADGRPVRALGTCNYITERKQAEEALRASRLLGEIAGRMARLGAWSVELPATRVVWSDVVAQIHGEAPGFAPTVEQAIDFYTPECRAVIHEHFARCVEAGDPFDLELQIITAAGQRRWVRAIGQPERDEAGRIVRVGGAFQEISDRKRAEQATREMAERLHNTLESITDAFFTLDTQWRFTYVNRRAEELLQRPRNTLLGREIWAEFPQAIGSLAHQEYERAVREAWRQTSSSSIRR